MNKYRNTFHRLAIGTLALASVFVNVGWAQAAQLSAASLSLSDPRPSQTSTYTITASGFTTATNIGCIEVDLGSSSDGTGSPAGLNTASSAFSSQTITATGTWAVNNTQSAAHKLRLTNATPVAPQTGSRTAVWSGVTNGSTSGTGYFGVFKTYTDDTCTTAVDTVTVQFIYTDGQQVTITVDPSLTFSVAGVASAQTVNGSTTNSTTSSTTIPLAPTLGTNSVAAQTITVSTNAGSGYTVYIRYTGQPASGSNDVDDLGGDGSPTPNSTPVAFTAAGTEAFGYTTEDTTLGTGTAGRFGSGNWAAFSTSNAEVAYNAAAVANQATKVGFQTGISTGTASGSYTSTVIYTCTPVF